MNNLGQILLTVLKGHFVRGFIAVFLVPEFHVALQIAVRAGGHTRKQAQSSLHEILTKLINIIIQQ